MRLLSAGRERVSEILDSLAARINRHENYVATFETTQGKKVLEHLCKVGFVTTSAYVAGDPQMTAYNNGKRDMVMAILRQVNQDQSALIKQIENVSTNE